MPKYPHATGSPLSLPGKSAYAVELYGRGKELHSHTAPVKQNSDRRAASVTVLPQYSNSALNGPICQA
jgi:hypothetical protein